MLTSPRKYKSSSGLKDDLGTGSRSAYACTSRVKIEGEVVLERVSGQSLTVVGSTFKETVLESGKDVVISFCQVRRSGGWVAEACTVAHALAHPKPNGHRGKPARSNRRSSSSKRRSGAAAKGKAEKRTERGEHRLNHALLLTRSLGSPV